MYACFLDLRIALERVRHSLSLRKLSETKVPMFVKNLLRSISTRSKICVSFNDRTSCECLTLGDLRQELSRVLVFRHLLKCTVL